MPIPTKWYASTMGGAPSLTNAAGSLIALLDACLLSGFGVVTLDSLTIASNVATLTKSAGHGFLDGQTIEIAGATPAAINGQWRFTRTSATQGTFATVGLGDQVATGTITAKTPGLNWAKSYSGSNLAAYKSQDVRASGALLRIADTATTMPRARGYQTMSDIDNGTEPFPTDAQIAGGTYFPKPHVASPAQPWFLVGDSTSFYLSVQINTSVWTTVFFGDATSLYLGDIYRALISGCASNGGTGYITYVYGSIYDIMYMPRSRTGVSGAVRCAKRGINNYSGYNPNYAYPSPANGGVLAWTPMLIEEINAEIRGAMPGYVELLNNCGASIPAGQIMTGVAGLSDPVICLRDNYGISQQMIGVSLGTWS